uniref:Uncharacterized protein n=1 Tax=uncultured marine virus TaxID=186617 RepID=A0A0F7L1T5_9VIRU|nr:hypothetical protein [uncultured marine virus]
MRRCAGTAWARPKQPVARTTTWPWHSCWHRWVGAIFVSKLGWMMKSQHRVDPRQSATRNLLLKCTAVVPTTSPMLIPPTTTHSKHARSSHSPGSDRQYRLCRMRLGLDVQVFPQNLP